MLPCDLLVIYTVQFLVARRDENGATGPVLHFPCLIVSHKQTLLLLAARNWASLDHSEETTIIAKSALFQDEMVHYIAVGAACMHTYLLEVIHKKSYEPWASLGPAIAGESIQYFAASHSTISRCRLWDWFRRYREYEISGSSQSCP